MSASMPRERRPCRSRRSTGPRKPRWNPEPSRLRLSTTMPPPFLLLPSDSPLLGDLHALKGASPARREQLQRLGIATIADLLLHLPRAYEDLSAVRTIANLTS